MENFCSKSSALCRNPDYLINKYFSHFYWQRLQRHKRCCIPVTCSSFLLSKLPPWVSSSGWNAWRSGAVIRPPRGRRFCWGSDTPEAEPNAAFPRSSSNLSSGRWEGHGKSSCLIRAPGCRNSAGLGKQLDVDFSKWIWILHRRDLARSRGIRYPINLI